MKLLKNPSVSLIPVLMHISPSHRYNFLPELFRKLSEFKASPMHTVKLALKVHFKHALQR